MTTVPPPLTLTPPNPTHREVVTADRAQDFVSEWKSQLSGRRDEVLSSLASSKGVGVEDVSEEDFRAASPVECDKVVLSGKSYTAAAAEVLYSFFTRNANNSSHGDDDEDRDGSLAAGVTVLDMSDVIASRPEDEGLQVLRVLSSAFAHSKLVEVNLSDNAMGSKGVSACSAVLDGQSDSLERLSLCNNGLSAEAMDEVADILTGMNGQGGEGTEDDALATDGAGVICERLTKLHFFNNMSGDGGCHSFARILNRCSNPTLRDIRFSSTRASDEGSAVVAAALDAAGANLAKLERLDLCDNTFKSSSTAALFRVLNRTTRLRYLDLRDCSLDDEDVDGDGGGCGKVCHALFGASPPLEHLDLSGNGMTAKGAGAVADLVEDAGGTLKCLFVEENELTSVGVKKIARAIYSLTSADTTEDTAKGTNDESEEGNEQEGQESAPTRCALTHLKLGTNECGDIGARALVDAYRAGLGLPNLTSIDLNGNGFSSEYVSELERTFGDKLGEMDDNDDEAEYDDELDSEGEGEDEGPEEGGEDDDEDDVGRQVGGTEDVDRLADELKSMKVQMSHDLV
eukprot:CAMPEP_0197436078 /NCGR_PEP_ID=MMETSP1175-20131217/3550_1 /TAXON_ID=1003142 /ORGANISM="Triceratium dubium, Strain CCMP147" /LENGTH=570 /DNA_ID=CAMNT_0042965267 /DNA_START=202 /DNA_END=1914 /DNA_ORIENTATION=+